MGEGGERYEMKTVDIESEDKGERKGWAEVSACTTPLPDWVCAKVAEEHLCDGTCPQLGQISDPAGKAIYACGVEGQVDETIPYSVHCPKHCRQMVCPMDMKRCDDGSFVARDFESGCEFKACPSPATTHKAPFCKASQQQLCKMKCREPECPQKGMCAMRQGNCCDYECVAEEQVVCPQVKCAERKGCKVKKSNKLDQNGCPKFPCGKVKKCKCWGNDAEWSDAQRSWCCKKRGKGCQSIRCEFRTRKQCRGPTPGPGFAQCAWNKSEKRCESLEIVIGRPFRSLEGTALQAAHSSDGGAAWDVQAPEF